MKTTIRVAMEVTIQRPPSEVWSYVTDATRMHEWLGEFKEAHQVSDGPTGRGSVMSYTLDGDRSGTLEIIEWEPPRRMGWDGPPLAWAGGGARPRGSHTLTKIDPGQTHLVSRYEPELSGTMVLLRPYLKGWLRRQRRKDAQVLKAILERNAAR